MAVDKLSSTITSIGSGRIVRRDAASRARLTGSRVPSVVYQPRVMLSRNLSTRGSAAWAAGPNRLGITFAAYRPLV